MNEKDTKNHEEELDVLVRDLTKVGSIPKSSARKRIKQWAKNILIDSIGGERSNLITVKKRITYSDVDEACNKELEKIKENITKITE